MNPFLNYLALTYLIYPLLGLLCIGLGIFMAKKNELLSNKRLIGYTIIIASVLIAPALFGFIDYHFMPVGYLVLSLFYFIAGSVHYRLLSWVFKNEQTLVHEIVFTSFLLIVGMAFFALVFNLCNELKYGMWACTYLLPFVLPMAFMKSYRMFMDIPIPIYKIWKYGEDTDIASTENIDYNQLKVVMLEIFKQETDSMPVTLNAKAADDMLFAVWFKRLLNDYNLSSPLSPVDNFSQVIEGGWIFYVKPSVFKPRKYIDFAKTFKENKIGERYTIVAKRII